MYSSNTQRTSWKQIIALVVLGLVAWQLAFAYAQADEADSAQSRLVGYVFSGDDQQGRVVNAGINLLDADGSVIATTTTNTNGSYSFDVLAGSYTIENTVNGETIPATVAGGIVMVGLDFYNTELSEVSIGLQVGTQTTSRLIGYVFGGENQDVRLVNTAIELLHEDGSPVLNVNGEPIVATTNAQGNYSFNVIAGSYLLRNTVDGELRTVDVADGIVMVGLDFYESSSSVANVPLAVSLNNVGVDMNNASWLTLIVAVLSLTALTLPKAFKVK